MIHSTITRIERGSRKANRVGRNKKRGCESYNADLIMRIKLATGFVREVTQIKKATHLSGYRNTVMHTAFYSDFHSCGKLHSKGWAYFSGRLTVAKLAADDMASNRGCAPSKFSIAGAKRIA